MEDIFQKTIQTDTSAIILNEEAVKLMELKDPLGKRLMMLDNENNNRFFTIIGILKDFNYESLHQRIRPLVIFLNKGQTTYLPIRIRPDNISKTISFVETQWKKYVPGKPFEYFFLNEDFDKLYQSEQKTGEIFTSFSVLAIFIACLGLFGLTAFTVERRIKEIGIRKVLGASISTIVYLISKEFLKWVLIANIIAWPVAYYFMSNWLDNFAYRIDITIWVFILSAVIALIIALVTVSSQTIKAATANPIKSLRYE